MKALKSHIFANRAEKSTAPLAETKNFQPKLTEKRGVFQRSELKFCLKLYKVSRAIVFYLKKAYMWFFTLKYAIPNKILAEVAFLLLIVTFSNTYTSKSPKFCF